jgi:hypothetical protein
MTSKFAHIILSIVSTVSILHLDNDINLFICWTRLWSTTKDAFAMDEIQFAFRHWQKNYPSSCGKVIKLQKVIKRTWAFLMILPWVHHKFKMQQLIWKLCNVHSLIGSYILQMNIMGWKHVWHIDKCVYKWNMNLWMNECHMNFASFNEFVYQMRFQCTILICKMYELWINKFCTISISKSWDVKFVMWGCTLKDI